jgi:hypothetical protein
VDDGGHEVSGEQVVDRVDVFVDQRLLPFSFEALHRGTRIFVPVVERCAPSSPGLRLRAGGISGWLLFAIARLGSARTCRRIVGFVFPSGCGGRGRREPAGRGSTARTGSIWRALRVDVLAGVCSGRSSGVAVAAAQTAKPVSARVVRWQTSQSRRVQHDAQVLPPALPSVLSPSRRAPASPRGEKVKHGGTEQLRPVPASPERRRSVRGRGR